MLSTVIRNDTFGVIGPSEQALWLPVSAGDTSGGIWNTARFEFTLQKQEQNLLRVLETPCTKKDKLKSKRHFLLDRTEGLYMRAPHAPPGRPNQPPPRQKNV